MINPFRKFAVTFDLEQLSQMIASARSTLEKARPGFNLLGLRHLASAQEEHDDAIAALQYNNYGQAETMLKKGLMHAYFAFRLGHARALPRKQELPEKPGRGSDAEERIAFLGSQLNDLKAAIEFGSCTVSHTARKQVERALQLYNHALLELKESDKLLAKRTAQAGILQLAFASELIRCDNGGTLPGGSGLASPLAMSPLRKLNQLAATIAQVYVVTSDKGAGAKDAHAHQQVKMAIQKLNAAIDALAKDNAVHAQALVVAGLNEINNAQALVESACAEEWAESADAVEQLFAHSNIEIAVSEIELILSRVDNPLSYRAVSRLDALLNNYSQARKAVADGKRAEAERLLSNALGNVDDVREILFSALGQLEISLSP